MTPLNPHAPQSGNSGFVSGLTIGLLLGLLVLCVGSGLGFAYVKRSTANARKGWNLVPVVVAAADLKEDTVLTMDLVSQRSVPEQFVTSSVIKPDSASYVINQRILVAVQAGDPLLWTQFETAKKKQAVVLFARSDVTSGKPLSEADLDEREVADEVLTASWVRTEDRPQALGKMVLAPFRKGDPIMWTHLKEEKR